MAKSTRDHLHRPLRSSPRDGAFLRTFAAVFAGLLFALAALVWVTDPLATFGTGLVPPIVSADRDYKATLYRVRRPSPEVVLLGSSRVKTIRPQCVAALTGRPAFNFGARSVLLGAQFVGDTLPTHPPCCGASRSAPGDVHTQFR